jgi:hypothetical protein
MRYKSMAYFLVLGMTLTVNTAFAQKVKANKGTTAQAGQERVPAFDPQSREILLNMCNFMKSQQEFSFKAEITDDNLSDGGKIIQQGFNVEAFVRRPDKLRVNGEGDEVHKQFIYDGDTFTLYDKKDNVYAAAKAPGDIEAALDTANKNFNVTVALADLASANLCEHVSGGISNGIYAGIHTVRGIPTHHFAFDKGDRHYQVWVEAGDKPLIRKIVITREGKPHDREWSAYLTDWNLSPQLQDDLFAFVPPQGAEKIEFAPVQTALAPMPKPQVAKKNGGKT